MKNNNSKPPKYLISTSEFGEYTGQTANDVANFFGEKELVRLSGSRLGIPSQLAKVYLALKEGVDYGFKVLAHINLKGGVGKTTSTISAATRAVQYGFRTCILDMDSQGSASLAFDMVPEDDDPIFFDVWQNPGEMVMGSLKKIQENLYILPSSLDNGLLDVNLINPVSQKNAVHGVCEELKANGFDLILIDCPPSLGTAVISTICAADIIVIPVCSDKFSFKGLKLTLNEIFSIHEAFNLEKPEIKILYTKFDRRLKISTNAWNRLSSDYKEYLIPCPIRTSAEFSKSLEKKQTVFASSKKSKAKADYDSYVRYALKLKGHQNDRKARDKG
ncbi:ParA family protein [Desulfonema magnum]|uniref:AAA ATPase-like domain-containing protein n=1 Tax=Desulfonema magnum TaxID=45655 RepID=A0A975BNP2_9BACT|nr:ParA family protein [Desulfonema magnum]QTA88255.1 AAA ATPase-like domain-containing protein [Desulfonema magnum]